MLFDLNLKFPNKYQNHYYTNKTVYKINLLLGYKKIKKDIDKTEYRALKNFYNVKKTKNYFFLKK